jgi:hypothetical protein
VIDVYMSILKLRDPVIKQTYLYINKNHFDFCLDLSKSTARTMTMPTVTS